MSYQAILFDMDGTLLNTVADLTDAVNHTMELFQLPLRTQQEVVAATGNGARRLVADCLAEGENTPRFEEIFAEYKSYYHAHSCIKTAPYAGLVDLLDHLRHAGCKVAIVSNKPDEATRELAQKFFPGVPAFGQRMGIPHKPAPDMVYHALSALGVEKEKAVYIGDSEVDAATARNADVAHIGVSWGFRSRQWLIEHGVEQIADTAEELEKMIAQND